MQALTATAHDTRYYLDAVQIDGAIVRATNGSLLVEIQDPHPFDQGDFPISQGIGEKLGKIERPILVSRENAVRLIAGTAKKDTIPVLTAVAFGTDQEGVPYGQSTDLSGVVSTSLANEQEQTFPATEKVMVRKGQREIVIALRLSAKMLADLAAIATTIGRKSTKNTENLNVVTLEIPVGAEYQGTVDGKPDGGLNCAIRFTMSGPELSAEGMVMPCRA